VHADKPVWDQVGTTCFHLSLRYWAQLVDELPIYYVMISGCAMLYRIDFCVSHNEPGQGHDFMGLRNLVVIWTGQVTAGLFVTLFTTGRESFPHQLFRGLMCCSFSVLFAGLFYGTARMLRRLQEKADVFHISEGELKDANALFATAWISIIVAIVCWVSDNAFCSNLQTLPFGIPCKFPPKDGR
jgi:hypothetical protein